MHVCSVNKIKNYFALPPALQWAAGSGQLILVTCTPVLCLAQRGGIQAPKN